MKITSNAVGNYSPTYMKTAQTAKKDPSNGISVEEKKFFANLYPAQKDEVMNYQFYNAKGKVTGAHVGSLFDRRG